MLSLHSVLDAEGISPDDVAVLLHTPKEPQLRKFLPWLVRERADLFEWYQSLHNKGVTATLRRRRFVLSFVSFAPSRLVLAGLYRIAAVETRSTQKILQDPEATELTDRFRLDYGALEQAEDWVWFSLECSDSLAAYAGRLTISPKPSRAYGRLAENFDEPIASIEREPVFDAPPPDWRALTISGPELRVLPESWAARLREWRGIYLIVDEHDGARYVGSAYGEANLLGRWQAHVQGSLGLTKRLSERPTERFRFSILERVSPDMTVEDVTALEQTWMQRLHTKEFGLNI
ncbi:MAG: GIY-YIG nuclease family protein [Pseudomonadota bacterium]